MKRSRRQTPERPQRLPRLSGAEHCILELLASDGELYGLQLVEQSQGRLKRGTVYVTLQRMEEKGMVESRLETRSTPLPGLPRRLYRPTRSGLALLRALELASAAFFDPEFNA
jgi:DNA-binding PadR family transcriptional regulator